MRSLFVLTIFLNSALLFVVQPMIGKSLLPRFGGSPLVWNTCLLFFQAALLLGYLYAHRVSGRFGPKLGIAHAFILLSAAVVGYLGSRGVQIPEHWPPAATLLALLATVIGVPFVALSAGAPLIQRLFSHTDHPHARDPYFLYSASNLGSMTALLGYPTLIEPNLTLDLQMTGFYVLAALLAPLIFICSRYAANRPDLEVEQRPTSPSVTARQKLTWTVLSAAPSALLLAVTVYVTTNIAPVPLLWIVPLALYLLTFIVAFASRPAISPRTLTLAMPAFVFMAAAWYLIDTTNPAAIIVPTHMIAFFMLALACHFALQARRPAPERLTEFYLWISVGGVVGGLFGAIVAPSVFTDLTEFPLAFVACVLLAGWTLSRDRTIGLRALGFAAVAGGLVALAKGSVLADQSPYAWIGVFLAVSVVAMRRPLTFALAVAGVFAAVGIERAIRLPPPILAERSFYGYHSVTKDPALNRLQLVHGTTIHGEQSLDPKMSREPISYYAEGSGVARIFQAYGEQMTDISCVGLGIGTIAAFGRPHQTIDFYELDPRIEKIARNPRLFTYLESSEARVRVIIGDARLSLLKDASYDLILLDAFSSDAVPVHLLTREAFGIYLQRLKPNGIIGVHITNRYLDLEPVISAVCRDLGLACLLRQNSLTAEQILRGDRASVWIAVAVDPMHLQKLRDSHDWRDVVRTNRKAWTDDYSNILASFRIDQ